MRKNSDVKRITGILTCIAVLCMLLILLTAFGVEKVYAAADVQYVGDVNGDGEITPKDVTMLRRYLAKGWNVDVAVEDADVDSDGDITPKDVTMLRRYLAKGWGVELPIKEKNSEIAIDETQFPDPVFRQYIIDNFDYDKNGSLSEWECTTVYELNVAGLGIKSLDGIEAFRDYLAYLRCYDNEIEELNLCNYKKLISVDCYNNKLKNLILNNNKSIVEIACYNNNLKNIDITNDELLYNFNCWQNDLSIVDISGCTRMIYCLENGEYGSYDGEDDVLETYHYRGSEFWADIYKDSKTRLTIDNATVDVLLQPQDVTLTSIETASFKVEATGHRLSYDWEYKSAGSDEWKKWDLGNTAKIEVSYLKTRDGMRFRCIVCDVYENKVISDEALLTYDVNGEVQYYNRPEPFALDEDLSYAELTEIIPNDDELEDPNGTYYYYYRQLTPEQKVIYWKLETLVEKEAFFIKGITPDVYYEVIDKASKALKRDNPLFGYQGNILKEEFDDNGVVVTKRDKKDYVDDSLFMHSEYVWNNVLENALLMLEAIPCESDRFALLSDLVSVVTDNIVYDLEGPYYIGYPQSITIYDLIGFFYYRECVCDGYGDGVKYLCDKLGIPCIIVRGTLHGELHEWNYIRLDDGKWYSLDLSGVYLQNIDPLRVLETKEKAIDFSNHMPEDLTGTADFILPELSNDDYGVDESYHKLEKTKVDFGIKGSKKEFIYEVNDDGITCTIIGYKGKQEGDLVIPNTVDGYTVTKIGQKAFYYNTGFTGDIIIPDTVREIERAAFLKCKGIGGTVQLPKNIETIGEFAFAFCGNLSGEIKFPDSLKKIGRCAFAYDESISGSLMLPQNLEELDNGVFTNCTGLTGIYYIPDAIEYNSTQISWTNISNFAVSDSNTRYKVSDGVLFSQDGTVLLCCAPGKTDVLRVAEGTVEIAEKACYDGKITGLILNDSLKKIGDKAFTYCYDLAELYIGEDLEEVGEMAFHYAGYNNGKLDCDLKLNNLKVLGADAFNRCKFTGCLQLSEYLTEIPRGAFCGSSFTGDLVIPNSVTKIGAYAFSGDCYNGWDLLNVFENKEKLILSENIVEIGDDAFNHAGLSGSLVLTGVKVGENAFKDNFFESIIE